MGKYTTYKKTPPKPRNLGVHPVMRGIGCIMMIVVPLLSYGIALFLVDYGIRQRWPLPASWLEPLSIHPLLLSLRGLDPVWNFLLRQDNLIAVLVFTIATIIVIGGLMSVLYGYIYTLFGPSQYGPQDAPPIRVKVKRYKR
ncbi:MAG TPA: hypothetical protein VJ830_02290 [Anaerolineales bacterium]|nr:hypothetical protein [Anaerolineales bacterium]